MTGAVSTSVLNGGGGPSHKCWDRRWRGFAKAATTRPAAPSAVRSAIAGRPARCVRRRSAGQLGRLHRRQRRAVFDRQSQPHQDRCVRSVHRSGRLCLRTMSLLYVKGGAAVVDDKYSIVTNPGGALLASTDDTRWGGVVGVGLEYGFAPNWSAGVEYDHMFLRLAVLQLQLAGGCRVPDRQHQAGRRSLHRPRELQVRRPDRRPLLISRFTADRKAPASRRGFFCSERGELTIAGEARKSPLQALLNSEQKKNNVPHMF